MTLGVLHIGAGEEDLGHGVVVLGEQLVIDVHQLALAHGCGGLLGGHVAGPLGKVQLSHPHGDGPGGHQHHLMAGVFQIAHHFAQGLHPADIELSRSVGEGGGAHFDYNTHRVLMLLSVVVSGTV